MFWFSADGLLAHRTVVAIGQLVGEIPYNILCSIVYWVLMVYPIGFGGGSAGINGTGFQLIVVIFMMLFGVSFGQLIAALTPGVEVAVLFNPVFGLTLSTFAGGTSFPVDPLCVDSIFSVTLPYFSMVPFWRWLYEVNPYTRALSSAVSTELQ